LRPRFSASRTISKKYLLTYPDRSKRHINREERDSLLLSGCAKQTGSQKYLYIGAVHTLHTLADLRVLSSAPQGEYRRFLQGQFTVVAPDGKRSSERLETPGGMTARLIAKGLVAA